MFRLFSNAHSARKAPETLKVTACYEAGFLGEGEISLAGPNALARARLAGEVLKEFFRARR